jgi:hypothetical protein
LFTKEQKAKLRDPALKFHLERTGAKTFVLSTVQEFHHGYDSSPNPTVIQLQNPEPAQPLSFIVQPDIESDGAEITLPDGSILRCNQKIERLQHIICQGGQAYLADMNRNKIADLTLVKPAVLPSGASKLVVKLLTKNPNIRFGFWQWSRGQSEKVGK